MTKQELVATHLRAAMASIEVVWALLDLDKTAGAEQPAEDPATCEHPKESREYVAMGRFTCKDCGHKEGG